MRTPLGADYASNLKSQHQRVRENAIFVYARGEMTKELYDNQVVTGIAEALTSPLSKHAQRKASDALRRAARIRKGLPNGLYEHFGNSLQTEYKVGVIRVAMEAFHYLMAGHKEKLATAVFAKAVSERLCSIGEIEYLIYAKDPPFTVRPTWVPPRSIVLHIGEILHDKNAPRAERLEAERLLRRLLNNRGTSLGAMEALAIGRYGSIAGSEDPFLENDPEKIVDEPGTPPRGDGRLTLDLESDGKGKNGMKVRGFSFSMEWGPGNRISGWGLQRE